MGDDELGFALAKLAEAFDEAFDALKDATGDHEDIGNSLVTDRKYYKEYAGMCLADSCEDL